MRRRVQLTAAAAAVGRRRRRRTCDRSASPVVHDLPAVGQHMQDHLEVYIQHACTQPVSMQPWLEMWRRPYHRAAVAVPQGPWRHATTSRRGGFVRSQRRRRLPQPDVPLPADRDPLRRLVAGRRARLPGAHRPDVLRLARLGADHVDRPDGQAGDAVQLPLDRAGPARVGRGDPRRPRHPRPAGDGAVQRRRDLTRARRSRPTSRSSTGCARDAETALHPSCTCRMGAADDDSWSTR